MNAALVLIIAFVLFYLAYRFYGKYIAKVFGENDKTPTPACSMKDDCDYVPTKPLVLFGHHFASIAAIFMMATTYFLVFLLFKTYLPKNN